MTGVALGVGLLVVSIAAGLTMTKRDQAAFTSTTSKVEAQARTDGQAMDLDAFVASWQAAGAGSDHGVAASLLPHLDGASLSSYHLDPAGPPPRLIADYQVDSRGLHGCVRLVRTASTTVANR
jgi:hypothetical protein